MYRRKKPKKSKGIRIQELYDFCKRHNIWIPYKNIGRNYLVSSIARMFYHNESPKSSHGCCYGYWESDNPNCLTCKFELDCFEDSIGMEKAEYTKRINKIDNLQTDEDNGYRD